MTTPVDRACSARPARLARLTALAIALAGCGAHRPPPPEFRLEDCEDGAFDDIHELELMQTVGAAARAAAPPCPSRITRRALAPRPLPVRPARRDGCVSTDAFEDGEWLVSIVSRDAERGAVGAFFDSTVPDAVGGRGEPLRRYPWARARGAFVTSPAPRLTIGTTRPGGRGEVALVRLERGWPGMWPISGWSRPPTRAAVAHALGHPDAPHGAGSIWRRGDVVVQIEWAGPDRIQHLSVWDAAAFDARAAGRDPGAYGPRPHRARAMYPAAIPGMMRRRVWK